MRAVLALLLVCSAACLHRPSSNRNVLVVGPTSGPNNLDLRIGTDDVLGKASRLIFNNLMTLDDHPRVVPDLAERLDHPDPLASVTSPREGVRFHDGYELTPADVVYTFRSLLDPALLSPRKGAYRMVQAIDARDRYTLVFTLNEPFGSFSVNLSLPIVPDGDPIGMGSYRFVRCAVDDQLELARFDQYFGGRPDNDGLVLKVVATGDEQRRTLYGDVQRLVAEEVPYVSLWCKTNVAVAERSLTGIHLLPTADFGFLKDVAHTASDRRAAR